MRIVQTPQVLPKVSYMRRYLIRSPECWFRRNEVELPPTKALAYKPNMRDNVFISVFIPTRDKQLIIQVSEARTILAEYYVPPQVVIENGSYRRKGKGNRLAKDHEQLTLKSLKVCSCFNGN
jgi:hypothetical protein